jgi:hypothetical protein
MRDNHLSGDGQIAPKNSRSDPRRCTEGTDATEEAADDGSLPNKQVSRLARRLPPTNEDEIDARRPERTWMAPVTLASPSDQLKDAFIRCVGKSSHRSRRLQSAAEAEKFIEDFYLARGIIRPPRVRLANEAFQLLGNAQPGIAYNGTLTSKAPLSFTTPASSAAKASCRNGLAPSTAAAGPRTGPRFLA